ncbi:MAG: hypothetical protein GY832_13715 [Chloroflexi bacterium]|nr:hypothetical protein [Chloroflexota bacterium]
MLNIHLLRRTMIQGLVLPLRAYFQPRRVADNAVRPGVAGDVRLSPMRVYLCSLAWVPIGILVGLLIFGFPEFSGIGLSDIDPSKQFNFIWILIILCGLAVLLGVPMGYWHRFSDGRSTDIFNYSIAAGFGVVLALVLFFSILMLDKIASRNNVGTGYIVNIPTLNFLNSFILGMAFGIIVNMFIGYHFGAKIVVVFGLPLGIGMIVALVNGANPEVQSANLVSSVTAAAFLIHLVWQPIYFVLGVTSNLLAKRNPAWSLLLWRISPVSWSEFCYVPLPGLSNLLMTLYHIDPLAGQQAINQLKRYTFYGAVGKRLSKNIEMEISRTS